MSAIAANRVTTRLAAEAKNSSDRWVLLCLVVGTLMFFGRLCRADFVNLDDLDYVSQNPHVLSGLSRPGIAWAFTTFAAANWHPLTWLSLQLDASLFGPGPAGFHTTNLLLHTANAALVFLVWRRMTGAVWPSSVVAVLFALHPLHVESVAWVSERKDLLSTLFGLLALLAYERYCRSQNARRCVGPYLAVVAAFALSLLAKPMLVTLPCVLLLLDWWPLRRLVSLPWLFVEKLPLFVLSGISSAVTILAQNSGGALKSLDNVPLPGRIASALQAYTDYLRQTFWPAHLAPFYPYRELGLTGPEVLTAAAVLAGISALVLVLGRGRPYLAVGWLWYLGTLVPVIGLVRVGMQARADHYTYFPLLGIFVALAWGAAEWRARWRLSHAALGAVASVILIGTAGLSWFQAGYWRNSEALWRHSVSAAPSGLAWLHLGLAHFVDGRMEEARSCYDKALLFDADDSVFHCSRGAALHHLGRLGPAEEDFKAAIRADPNNTLAHTNLANLLSQQGRRTEAITSCEAALRANPDLLDVRIRLGTELLAEGQLEEAHVQLAEAVRRYPTAAPALDWLGMVDTARGRYAEAVVSFAEAARLDPSSARTWHQLAQAQGLQGHWQEARDSGLKAARLAPQDGEIRGHLALCLSQLGDATAARREFDLSVQAEPAWPQQLGRSTWQSAIRAGPGKSNAAYAVYLARLCCQATGDRDPELLDLLAAAQAQMGEYQQAVATAQIALDRARERAELGQAIRARLKLYESGQPYREPAGP